MENQSINKIAVKRNFFQKILLWFTPDGLTDEQISKLHTVIVFCYCTFPFNLFYLFMNPDWGGSIRSTSHLVCSAILITIPFLFKLGMPMRWGVNMYLFAGFQTFIVAIYYTGGIFSPVLFWVVFLPLCAIFMSNTKDVYFWLLMSALISIGFYSKAVMDAPVPDRMHLFTFTVNIGLILLLFTLFFISERNKNALMTIIQNKNFELERSKKFKDEFIANVSHELRSPMNAIVGLTDLLFKKTEQPENKMLLKELLSASKDHVRIINDILDISRIEAGKMSIEPIHFNLPQLVQNIIELYKNEAAIKNLQLNLKIDASIPEIVFADSVRIRQILNNLIGNALKFTEHGSVDVTIQHEADNGLGILLFSVKDTGIGIPNDKLELIFESFAQADLSHSKRYGGTGLGLFITRQLVYLLNGEISVYSKSGKGSEFVVAIPVEKGEANAIDTQHVEITADIKQSIINKKILIVEDKAVNRLVLKNQFEHELGKTDLTFAENGIKAIELINSDNFDVVLMDVQMPGMDGIQTTQKAIEINPNLKIIALTASGTTGEIEHFTKIGFCDILIKPYELNHLFLTIWKASNLKTTDAAV
jgi:signal transduction histidine kinase/ActR/RegA family two-component response regulator